MWSSLIFSTHTLTVKVWNWCVSMFSSADLVLWGPETALVLHPLIKFALNFNKFSLSGLSPEKIHVILVAWIWSDLWWLDLNTLLDMNLAKGSVWDLTTFPKKTLLRQRPRYEYMWEGTSSSVRKNGYVPLGAYQNNNLNNFGGGPVQYSKQFSYSNFLGRTTKKITLYMFSKT